MTDAINNHITREALEEAFCTIIYKFLDHEDRKFLEPEIAAIRSAYKRLFELEQAVKDLAAANTHNWSDQKTYALNQACNKHAELIKSIEEK